jgi:hypothetical protein
MAAGDLHWLAQMVAGCAAVLMTRIRCLMMRQVRTTPGIDGGGKRMVASLVRRAKFEFYIDHGTARSESRTAVRRPWFPQPRSLSGALKGKSSSSILHPLQPLLAFPAVATSNHIASCSS